MIKTILVPIDIAQMEAGANALELARDLANTHECKFILLNVVAPVPGYLAMIPAGIHETALSDAAARLNEIVSEHGIPDISKVVVREGRPATEILEFAKETGADLIVIASHDPGFVDYFLGSVAARVVRHAHCSVLVARKLES